MKIIYQIPYINTVYAGRFIYEGYRDAFTKLGHELVPLTSNQTLRDLNENFHADILLTSLHVYTLKFLNLSDLKRYRDAGLFVLSAIPSWNSNHTVHTTDCLKKQTKLVNLLKSGDFADVCHNIYEEDCNFMAGFTRETGIPFETILLAADSNKYKYKYDENYACDISYVGHYLPEKREFIKKQVIPLMKKYDVKIYGCDWTPQDRFLGLIQKGAQFINFEPLKGLRKVPVYDDNIVYSSSTINLNFHGDYQVKYGSDINERTFKIPCSGGFEICDNVKIIRNYFSPKELVIAENSDDWFDKIDYYLKNPEKRIPIINAGRKKVLKDHTYLNRAKQIIEIYEKNKRKKIL